MSTPVCSVDEMQVYSIRDPNPEVPARERRYITCMTWMTARDTAIELAVQYHTDVDIGPHFYADRYGQVHTR